MHKTNNFNKVENIYELDNFPKLNKSYNFSIHGLPSKPKMRPKKEAGGPNWRFSSSRLHIPRDMDPEH